MNSVFSEQILADKLSKLNSTQQCIETLSHWCIFHRNKAELVVATWDKQFHSSDMAQKVPLLYLANDILQNSKRKGNEFVTDFWKVLPSALKSVLEKGDDRGKNAVGRLVEIWEARRVFGSRGNPLKDAMLGEESPQPLDFSKKRSRSVSSSVKIVRRDLRSIRTKLSIGGTAEKIVSALHLVLSEHPSEDAEMSKCKSVVHHVRKIEKDVDIACTKANDPRRKSLATELEKEGSILEQCIDKLKSFESNRVALVSQLREALHEQESELEIVRTQMQVAQAQVEEAVNMRKRLNDEQYITVLPPSTDSDFSSSKPVKKSAAAIAAEVADKLTASTSSQLIMSSVLSTFAAEEAKSAGLSKPSDSVSKLETPMSIANSNVFMQAQPMNTPPLNNPYQTLLVPQQSMQTQASSSQAHYHLLPNRTSQQFLQQSGTIMTTAAYGYGSIPPLPPGPPPPPPHMVSPMVPLTQQPMQMAQQLQMQIAPQPPNFQPLQPPGMMYHAHPHHSL